MAESSPSNLTIQATKSNRSKVDRQRDFDDSDDETDDYAVARFADHTFTSPPQYNIPTRLVNISDSASTTYHTVLCWIHTGQITFAPLRLSFRHQPVVAAKSSSRLDNVLQLLASPFHPFPASPKSVYRLAHFLELDDLAKLALANIKSQLTTENIAYELFGDVAAAYEAVGEMELEMVVKQWAFVKDTQAMKEMGRIAEDGEVPSLGGMGYRLCRQLAWSASFHSCSYNAHLHDRQTLFGILRCTFVRTFD